jgi:hypothetical protein
MVADVNEIIISGAAWDGLLASNRHNVEGLYAHRDGMVLEITVPWDISP